MIMRAAVRLLMPQMKHFNAIFKETFLNGCYSYPCALSAVTFLGISKWEFCVKMKDVSPDHHLILNMVIKNQKLLEETLDIS